MPGILDIAPPEIATERFEIRGGSVEVRAIRNREWAALLRRFPDLNRQEAADGAVDPDTLDRMGAMIPAVIAAAAGACGDEKSETAIAERLTEAEQLTIFNAVMRLTNPPAPLAGSLAAVGQVANGQAETITPRPSSS